MTRTERCVLRAFPVLSLWAGGQARGLVVLFGIRGPGTYHAASLQICIFVNHSTAPYSVKNKLKPGQMEMLKVIQTQGSLYAHFLDPSLLPLVPFFPVTTTTTTTTTRASEPLSSSLTLQLTMNKRYNVSQQALDLQNLRFDPGMADSSNSKASRGRAVCLRGRLRDGNLWSGWCWLWSSQGPPSLLIPFSWLLQDLMGCDIDIILNRRNCMAATLKIIERNFPEVNEALGPVLVFS